MAQPTVHSYPYERYVDLVRWLPPILTTHRHAVLACVNTKPPYEASVELHAINPRTKTLNRMASWNPSSRISCVNTSQFQSITNIVASTVDGSLLILGYRENGDDIDVARRVHDGLIFGLDVLDNGCVTVGRDRWVKLTTFGASEINITSCYKSKELGDYTAVKWSTSSEFVTGGEGFGLGLQWWDTRSLQGPVLHLKNKWNQAGVPAMIKSVDIHPSENRTCVAGGRSGLCFVWDLRWPQQALILSGVELKSDIQEVKLDPYGRSSILQPVVMGSQNGILAAVQQGSQPVELLSGPNPIRSFDIHKQHPSEILCSFNKHAGVAIVSRARNPET